MRINFVAFVVSVKNQEMETVRSVKETIPTAQRKPRKGKRGQLLQPRMYKVVKARKQKKKDVVDLRRFVEMNYKKTLPFYKGTGVRITELLLCSSNTRCEAPTGKKQKRANKNYVLQQIKNGTIVNKNKTTKPVVCRVKGITKDGDKLEIRIPTTGNIKMTIGLSNNKNVAKNDETLVRYLNKIVKELILERKGLPELQSPKISNMVVTGGKLFNGKIKVFKTFHQDIVKKLEKHMYYYEEPINTNRKTFDKITIRSDDERFPTISIFRNGKIDFLGSKELKWVYKAFETLTAGIKNLKFSLERPSTPAM